jgi:MarR family transcriptional regulator, 2-MHQ and catechol-resistance regulon repressor
MSVLRTKESDADSTTGPKLWVVLARAYKSFASFIESCVEAEGLCLSDFMVLEVLLHKGPMTISAIGEKVLLANASMTSAVDRLHARGSVLRKNHESDRRIRMVELTPEGHGFISELYERHAKELEAVVSVLTQAERALLRSSLKKLGFSTAEAASKKVAATDKHGLVAH